MSDVQILERVAKIFMNQNVLSFNIKPILRYITCTEVQKAARYCRSNSLYDTVIFILYCTSSPLAFLYGLKKSESYKNGMEITACDLYTFTVSAFQTSSALWQCSDCTSVVAVKSALFTRCATVINALP